MTDKEEGFKIVDKRKQSDENHQADRTAKENENTIDDKKEKENEQKEFHLTFETYIMQLATQGFIALGLIPNPINNKTEMDIRSAKYLIDLLEIIEEKTKNNLTENEANLMKNYLYELRMKYVQAIKK